jgi:EAL and modified HD-GYP domain-containing signal transduction protein
VTAPEPAPARPEPVAADPAPSDPASSNEAPPAHVLAVRHPIYDNDLRPVAYELMLRAPGVEGAVSPSPGLATPKQVVALADELVGTHPVHVKVYRDVITTGVAAQLPADKLVLELTGDVAYDEELGNAITALRDTGHAIVLDGFGFADNSLPLLRLARGVKIDTAEVEPPELERRLTVARAQAPETVLIATGIDTHASLELAKDLGFALFQGFFYLTPEEGDRGELQANQLLVMRLLAELQDPETDFDKLQETISRDVALSYELLRLVNSAFFALPRRVESVRDAAVLLGLDQLRQWATFIVLTRSATGKPSEVLVSGLTRARMCQLLGPRYGGMDTEPFFTTGLFSIVDALMDVSMIEVLATLPFSEEINRAILNFEGDKGSALRAAVAWERGNLAELVLPPDATIEDVAHTYRAALTWAVGAVAGRV